MISFIQEKAICRLSRGGWYSASQQNIPLGGIWGKSRFYRALNSNMETGRDWLGLHIWPYLERSGSKEIGLGPRVGLALGDWLTEYIMFPIKHSICTKVQSAKMASEQERLLLGLEMYFSTMSRVQSP